jgi:GntR family transcriptional regulator
LQRLRLADDEVVMYEKTYLLEKKMQGLSKNILLENPLYDILQNRYNISFTKATERFSVLLADEKIAEILTIPQGSPIIRLQRWTYAGMEIIEYTVSLVRGDRFEFEVELEEK